MEKELESHPRPKEIHVVDFAGYHEVMSEPFYEACNLLNEGSNAMAETFARNLEHRYNSYEALKAANAELIAALEQLAKEVRKGHVDGEGLIPGCPACNALKEAESLISKHKAK